MLHFAYTYTEHKAPRDGSGIKRTVTLYRIKRNTPILVGALTDTFMSEFQQVLMCAKHHKALPTRAFKENQFGGFVYCHAYLLRDAGIASITRI